MNQKYPKGYWDIFENCKAEAQKHRSLSQFHSKSRAAYNACIRNGWFDILCGNMPKVLRNVPSTKSVFISQKPELMQIWSKEGNPIGLASVTRVNSRKVMAKWICPNCGEEFSRIVSFVNRGSILCHKCSSKNNAYGFIDKKLKEKGSFEDNYPSLAINWDTEKNKLNPRNGRWLPSQFLADSNVSIYWKCKNCNYEWKEKICSRRHATYPCPQCYRNNISNLVFGNIPLSKTHPDLIKMWDKENKYSPKEITAHDTLSMIKWICPRGHRWTSSPNFLINVNHCKCPKCQKEMQTSFPEQAIFYYMSKNTNAINRFKVDGVEIDVYLPDYNIGIEYDGKFYHKGEKAQQKEIEKDKFLESKGIKVIRIKERDNHHNLFENNVIFVENDSELELESVINYLFEYLLIPKPDIDLARDKTAIYEQYIFQIKKESIATKAPNLLKEWNYEKNGSLLPDYFSYKSSRKVWWKCEKGHEWEAVIYSRHNYGCPYCSGLKTITGENDLATLYPELMNEWDFEANQGINPHEIASGSSKTVSWICNKCKTRWKAQIVSRTHRSGGCPECAKHLRQQSRTKTLISQKGSFGDNHPDFLLDWNYEKNKGIDPFNIPNNSRERVFWLCHECGFE